MPSPWAAASPGFATRMEGDEVVGYAAAFGLVGWEDGAFGEVLDDEADLPG